MRVTTLGCLAWLGTFLPCALSAEPPTNIADLHTGRHSLESALPLLDTDDTDFERVFPELLKRNPKWRDEAVALLRAAIARPTTFDQRERDWAVLLQGFRDEEGVAARVAEALTDRKIGVPARQHLVRLMARMQAPPSDAWLDRLALLLKDGDLRRDVLAVVRKHSLRDFDRAIANLIKQDEMPLELRIAAMDAIAARLTLTPDQFKTVLREVRTNPDPVVRVVAGRTLAALRLTEAQAKELANAFTSLSGSTGMLVLPAFHRLRDAEIGRAVLKSLQGSTTAKFMNPADLDRLLAPYPDEVLQAANGLRAELVARVAAGEAESFGKLSRTLPPGDARRGREVFLHSKAACASCHRAEGQGGGIGPNLSRVGFLRNPSELLESIVLPNASMIPEFRAWKVTTDRGLSFTGFLVADTADSLYLREADRTLRRIARSAIDEVELSRISLMPEGLDKLLSRQQLADLVQFLAELR